jgi:hypothetical protein
MGKQLSIGDEEILLKSVAQAIPIFALSIFSLPVRICKEITDLVTQFWWGNDKQHKKCFGFLGESYAIRRVKVAWGLGLFNPST